MCAYRAQLFENRRLWDKLYIKLTEPGFFDAGYGVIPGIAAFGTAHFSLIAWSDRGGYEDLWIMGQVQWNQKTGELPSPPLLPIVPDLENPPLHFIPEPSTIVLSLIGGALLLTKRVKCKARC